MCVCVIVSWSGLQGIVIHYCYVVNIVLIFCSLLYITKSRYLAIIYDFACNKLI